LSRGRMYEEPSQT